MKYTIIVKLKIEADSPHEAINAVDSVLDCGVFQDSINEWSADDWVYGQSAGTVKVLAVSADFLKAIK